MESKHTKSIHTFQCILFFKCYNFFSPFSPPVNPEAEVDDPTDTKPSNWDEREK